MSCTRGRIQAAGPETELDRGVWSSLFFYSLYSSPPPFLKILIFSPEISVLFPLPHLIFFFNGLNIKGKMMLPSISLFPRYILPHSHDIPFSSAQNNILSQQTWWTSLLELGKVRKREFFCRFSFPKTLKSVSVLACNITKVVLSKLIYCNNDI